MRSLSKICSRISQLYLKQNKKERINKIDRKLLENLYLQLFLSLFHTKITVNFDLPYAAIRKFAVAFRSYIEAKEKKKKEN
jgi:hypothetical protein